MSKIKNPQEKKRKSLAKDCRNNYGEYGKSRKSIRRNKRIANSAARTKANRLLTAARANDYEDLDTTDTHKGKWQKCPDQPLGSYLDHTNKREAKMSEWDEIDPHAYFFINEWLNN